MAAWSESKLDQMRASFEQTLAQRSQQLDEALLRIAACEADIAQERARQEELAGWLRDAEHRLSVLQTSLSWRMTQPARLLTQGHADSGQARAARKHRSRRLAVVLDAPARAARPSVVSAMR